MLKWNQVYSKAKFSITDCNVTMLTYKIYPKINVSRGVCITIIARVVSRRQRLK